MNALRLYGLSIPGDILVMGHDDLHSSLHPDTGLTTLHIPMAEIGKAAVRLAVALIQQDGPDSAPAGLPAVPSGSEQRRPSLK